MSVAIVLLLSVGQMLGHCWRTHWAFGHQANKDFLARRACCAQPTTQNWLLLRSPRARPAIPAPILRSRRGAAMDFRAERREFGGGAESRGGPARSPGPVSDAALALRLTPVLLTRAEALEEFLSNFLAVSRDERGKTVTTPKYMAMLVRAAMGRHRRRPPPAAARLWGVQTAPSARRRPLPAPPSRAPRPPAARHCQPEAADAGGGAGRPGGVQQGAGAGGARGGQHAAVSGPAGGGGGQRDAGGHGGGPAGGCV